MTLGQLANEYLGILQHEENPKYHAVIIHECMVCKKFKTMEEDYILIHQALREVYETDKQYQISHGFCKPCADAYRRDNGLVR